MNKSHNLKDIIGVMDKFLLKLVDSDYDTSTREEIIRVEQGSSL